MARDILGWEPKVARAILGWEPKVAQIPAILGWEPEMAQIPAILGWEPKMARDILGSQPNMAGHMPASTQCRNFELRAHQTLEQSVESHVDVCDHRKCRFCCPSSLQVVHCGCKTCCSVAQLPLDLCTLHICTFGIAQLKH